MSLITRGLNSTKLITQGLFGKLVNIIKPDVIVISGEVTDHTSFTGVVTKKITTSGSIGKISYNGEIS